MSSAEIHDLEPLSLRVNKLELVERLADDLAHEIKNPLHSMVINLEVLKRRIARAPAEGSEELLRYAGILGSELERASRRVELLLRMIRPDRAGDPVSLAATLEETVEIVALQAERRRVTLEHQPGSAPLTGSLERAVTRQFVLNLLLTALDLAPERGTIRVRTESYGGAEHLRVELPDVAGEPPASALEIPRALVELLGGRLEATAEPDRLSFQATVPALGS